MLFTCVARRYCGIGLSVGDSDDNVAIVAYSEDIGRPIISIVMLVMLMMLGPEPEPEPESKSESD
jgi:hypothetical protein